MAAKKDPITTHCLDQTSGTPASNIHTTLRLLSPASKFAGIQPAWTASTSPNDGRINTWTPSSPESLSEPFLSEIIAGSRERKESLEFSLSFQTGPYWKAKGQASFYPRVEVVFEVNGQDDGREHWHVPVLLGPWGYTTYRGS
ncbi:hypothetical protein MMC10_008628 [Thelotrema lepadinum]|nr:hypothetical protein [Thelotrema lepadinum]